ncbi:hypothetical protein H7F33_07100 [Pedobacter sp. PAMC26386]|nr:hypothetical protein H7F33_07100 [Pedobacter sp. PAMC26386]
MENLKRLNKAQRRKFLEYLDAFEATIYRPSQIVSISQRKKSATAQRYRNIKCACAILKHYADFDKKHDERPNFRKTRIYDAV